MTMNLPDAVERWPIDRLEPYARNARTHGDDQVARIAASMVEFGWTVPVLVDGDGGVIAGHGRLLAAHRLGLDSVPVIRLEHLTPAQVRAYRIADNRLTDLGAWDDDLLASELHALNGEGFDLALTGFDDTDLDRLMAPLDDAEPDETSEDDDAENETPEPPRNPVTHPGDLWLLGDHRLLCGDSTDAEAVARVMAGERADLLFTSPPYGNQRDYTTGGVGDWDVLMRGVFADPPMTDDGQVLVNLGLIHRANEWQPYWEGWLEWMRERGWRRFGLYVWDQGPGLPGDWNGRLAPAFEFVFHFNREARAPNGRQVDPCGTAGAGDADSRQRDPHHPAQGTRPGDRAPGGVSGQAPGLRHGNLQRRGCCGLRALLRFRHHHRRGPEDGPPGTRHRARARVCGCHRSAMAAAFFGSTGDVGRRPALR